jgi:adenosylmethionine-8-amino-7-oxononanoate aminotransferase
LVRNRETKLSFSKNNGATNDSGKLNSLDNEFMKRGINIKLHPLGIFIVPPLCITREEIDFALDAIDEVLTQTVDQWMDD